MIFKPFRQLQRLFTRPRQRPKIAFYWCASCGGCEESIIDLAEDLLTLRRQADIVFWPVAMDTKRQDIEAMEDGAIDLTLINGAVRTDDQAEMALLLRKKSKILMAHGTCAHLGGVVGLANFHEPQAILDRAFKTVPTLAPDAHQPPSTVVGVTTSVDEDNPLSGKGFHDRVKSLDQVVPVDYTIPGCPPTPALVKDALEKALAGTLPGPGAVLADSRPLCHTCPLVDTRLPGLLFRRFHRLQDVQWDPDVCFLNQGLICLGPATRGGCDARCIQANMPCRGCFGPLDADTDAGAAAVSFISTLLEDAETGDNTEHITRAIDTIPDLTGLVYRYALSKSTLGKRHRDMTKDVTIDVTGEGI